MNQSLNGNKKYNKDEMLLSNAVLRYMTYLIEIIMIFCALVIFITIDTVWKYENDISMIRLLAEDIIILPALNIYHYFLVLYREHLKEEIATEKVIKNKKGVLSRNTVSHYKKTTKRV